jgi:hypothetical protein
MGSQQVLLAACKRLHCPVNRVLLWNVLGTAKRGLELWRVSVNLFDGGTGQCVSASVDKKACVSVCNYVFVCGSVCN